MKIWEIYHCIYGNVIGHVIDTEENIKALVEKLNTSKDDYDDDFCDEDYYGYKEFKITTIDEIEHMYLK